jgi:hypothetical protein
MDLFLIVNIYYHALLMSLLEIHKPSSDISKCQEYTCMPQTWLEGESETRLVIWGRSSYRSMGLVASVRMLYILDQNRKWNNIIDLY